MRSSGTCNFSNNASRNASDDSARLTSDHASTVAEKFRNASFASELRRINSRTPSTLYRFECALSAAGRNAAVGGKKIFVHQQRPNLEDVFKRIIVAFEGVAAGRSLERVEDIDPALRDSWCGLYCGGSHNIQNMLAGAARKWGVGWQAELFDW